MKKTVTWIVVADHQHARFFENDGPGHGIQAIEDLSLDTHLHRNSEILSDHAGRSVSTRNGQHHIVGASGDPHQQEGFAFMRRVADIASDRANDQAYDRLILIAPPRALGELRKTLSDSAKRKVIAELNEDLTKATIPEILKHLSAHLAT